MYDLFFIIDVTIRQCRTLTVKILFQSMQFQKTDLSKKK